MGLYTRLDIEAWPATLWAHLVLLAHSALPSTISKLPLRGSALILFHSSLWEDEWVLRPVQLLILFFPNYDPGSSCVDVIWALGQKVGTQQELVSQEASLAQTHQL